MRTTLHLGYAPVVSLVLSPALVLADATLRYQTEVKINPDLPPQLAQTVAKGSAASVPEQSSMQFRNGKEFYATGKQDSITDFRKKEITVIDRETKRYATVRFEGFGEGVRRALPPSPPATAQVKSHFETRATNRTAIIQGIEGQEHESVRTIDAPTRRPPLPAQSCAW
jgi:hypothetical protein